MGKNVDIELKNLMALLDEKDDSLFSKISETILSYGGKAIPYLEIIGENSLDDLVHSRSRLLIHKIRIQNLYRELHTWATLHSNDLLKGFFIISKYQFPDLEEEVVMAKVEALKKEVWLELNKEMIPHEELKVISKVFFEVRKFTLNQNPGSMPDCVYLNALLNSGKGYPDAFSLLYAGIAQRLGIPVYGVAMPNSMFLAYVATGSSEETDFKNNVMLYLNPFAAGVFFPIKETEDTLKKIYGDDSEKYRGACTNVEFLFKILEIIKDHYTRKNRPEKVEEVVIMMSALETA